MKKLFPIKYSFIELSFEKRLREVIWNYFMNDSNVEGMRCPSCGAIKGLQARLNGFDCVWRNCYYHLSDNDYHRILEELIAKKVRISKDKLRLLKRYINE